MFDYCFLIQERTPGWRAGEDGRTPQHPTCHSSAICPQSQLTGPGLQVQTPQFVQPPQDLPAWISTRAQPRGKPRGKRKMQLPLGPLRRLSTREGTKQWGTGCLPAMVQTPILFRLKCKLRRKREGVGRQTTWGCRESGTELGQKEGAEQ